jgi:hypothetical protein
MPTVIRKDAKMMDAASFFDSSTPKVAPVMDDTNFS